MSEPSAIPVFAYGSNLCVERLLARTRSARVLGVGSIESHTFAFHKRSGDGSAKADAFYTGNPSDRVWGAVYALTPGDKLILDRFEGLGVHYDLKPVSVALTPGGEREAVEAWVYVSRHEHLDASVQPFEWYHRFCVHGARQHGLPRDYCAKMEALAAIPDPDFERRRVEESVFEGPLVELGRALLEQARRR